MAEKPTSLRWTAAPDGTGGILKPRRGLPIQLALTSALGAGVGVFAFADGRHIAMALGAGLAALILAGCAALALWTRTTVTCSAGLFQCERGPWPRSSVRHPLVDIRDFSVVAQQGDPCLEYAIYLVTQNGARIELPLPIEGDAAAAERTARAMAPAEHASYVAEALLRSVEEARRSGGSYRVAPANAATDPADDGVASDNDSSERRRGR